MVLLLISGLIVFDIDMVLAIRFWGFYSAVWFLLGSQHADWEQQA